MALSLKSIKRHGVSPIKAYCKGGEQGDALFYQHLAAGLRPEK
jgi:hypothetical protein